MSPRSRPLGQLPPDPPRFGALIETDEEVRQAIQSSAANQHPVPAPHAAPPSTVRPYYPTQRPPAALLTVCDDGTTDGETVRLRADRFVIGRTEGDLLIPHDELISTRHVEITRQLVGGVHRWVLTDLQSTNGLFIRVTRTALADQAEILVGGGRYRFEAPTGSSDQTADHLPGPPQLSGSTRDWGDQPAPLQPPALTELVAGGIGNRVVLTRPEYWIGTDPGCAVCRPDDRFCEPRHVRLYRGPAGGWSVEHNKTLNGLWCRVPQLVLTRTVQFQVGEQRFRLRV